jgi:spermidine/putrescine transport system substrate-binding protein
MTMKDRNDFLSREKFMEELWRYKKGSVTRRHFLGVTGLGLATSVLSSAIPGLRSAAHAQGSIRPTSTPSPPRPGLRST